MTTVASVNPGGSVVGVHRPSSPSNCGVDARRRRPSARRLVRMTAPVLDWSRSLPPRPAAPDHWHAALNIPHSIVAWRWSWRHALQRTRLYAKPWRRCKTGRRNGLCVLNAGRWIRNVTRSCRSRVSGSAGHSQCSSRRSTQLNSARDAVIPRRWMASASPRVLETTRQALSEK